MTRDETLDAIAKVLAGLQVPVSLGMPLGAAREPWGQLHEAAGGLWRDAADYRAMLEAVLEED